MKNTLNNAKEQAEREKNKRVIIDQGKVRLAIIIVLSRKKQKSM